MRARLRHPAAASMLVAALLAAAPPAAQAQARALPGDVSRFVARRDLCDHFRGEDPYDAERRRFLAAQMQRYCAGTDARLAALRRKYRASSEVMRRLEAYETRVESP